MRVADARRAGSDHSRGVARAAARDVRARRGGHRESRARAARERGDGRVIRLGVVGHLGYEDLPAVLRTLERARARARARAVLRARAVRGRAGRGDLLEDPQQLDALLTLGGDGTLLRGARVDLAASGSDSRRQSRPSRISHLLQRRPAAERADALRAAATIVAESRMALEARVLDARGVERAAVDRAQRRRAAQGRVRARRRRCASPPTASRSRRTRPTASCCRRRPDRRRTACRPAGRSSFRRSRRSSSRRCRRTRSRFARSFCRRASK